jgi:hypothetical protein
MMMMMMMSNYLEGNGSGLAYYEIFYLLPAIYFQIYSVNIETLSTQ